MNIRIICVGKIKEAYLNAGIEEYLKRLQGFCQIEIYEVKEVNTNDLKKNINLEGQAILNVINTNDIVWLLSLDGKNIDSLMLASKIKEHFLYNDRLLVFVIGGSNGVSLEVKNRSDFQISFGKITFPHQLIRLVLIEQIYRAMMINNNHSYHK